MSLDTNDPAIVDWANSMRPYRELAGFVGCNAIDVAMAFDGLEDPEMATRTEVAALSGAAERYKSAAGYLRKAAHDLRGLPGTELGALALGGGLSVDAIEAAAVELEETAKHRRAWANRYGPRNRRNAGAHIAAEGVARLFEYLGKPVTWGRKPETNDPRLRTHSQ